MNGTIRVGNGLLSVIVALFMTPVVALANFEFAADRVVSGKVTSQTDGLGIPGVNIIIKGSTLGTVTDAEGNYSISVPDEPGVVLVFSAIGYATQERTLNGESVLNVQLSEDVRSLDEVVVVGYGTESKRFVTGSVSSIDMTKAKDFANVNVAQSMLSVPGVQFTNTGRPGANGTLLIRGQSSLSAANDPLIVLDGIIFNGDLLDINPGDIQSIEVLKDAASSSIYGSRAANGVILITSKRGITQKPNVRVNTFYGVSDVAKELKLLTPERYIQRRLDWRKQSGLEADPAKITDYLALTEVQNYTNGISHNPWDVIYQDANIFSADVSVSGMSENVNYYLSAALTDEKGLIFNDNQKRVTLRSNLETKVATWLTIGMNATFSHRNLSGVEANLRDAYRSSPFGTFYHPDGEPTQFPVPEETAGGNPMRDALLTTNEEIVDNLFSNFYGIIELPFIPGLSYRINYSPNYRWYHDYNFFRQDRHVTFNSTNASKYDRKSFQWVVENILKYERNIGQDHFFDITLMYGRNHSDFESTTSNASFLSVDALGYNDLSLGDILTVSSSAQATEGISSMARLNYRFKDRYMVTLTARRDGSSVFAANNKFATFPSVGAAWLVSDENFFNEVGVIDMLKLRVSYGAAGNQAIGPYQSLSLAAITHYVYGDGGSPAIGVYPATIGNNDLKWETTYTANVAVDFELFNSRLGGTIEAYNSNTHDLLVNRTIPTMTGYDNILTNIGQVNNKGIELTLNSINVRRDRFEWSTNAAFSYNKNTIVHLFETDLDNDGKEDDVVANSWFVGHPIHSYYDYVFDGIYQEGDDDIPASMKPGDVRVKDINNDGAITTEDRTIVGSGVNPKYRFNIRNNFTYGNFTLSVAINGMQGWISPFNLINPLVPGRALGQLDAGWWTPENRSNTRPSLVYANPLGVSWYVSRDFVRIQDISLSYQFPAPVLERLKLSNLKVYVSGKNIHTFTDWLGADPEGGGDYSSLQGSGDLFPMPRTFTVGLNVGL
ncbi:MAG: TonB-dependent receptor [Bacteroidota bacterium]|jgi:TonB-linked SusC/RagA family outer membrane protein|nr:MAG: SusC/RagA family TonB-linked outer membrane protein [Bacteroidota bacterium]